MKRHMPSIALVFGHGSHGDVAGDSESSGADNSEGKKAAGEDMLAAIKAEDPMALADAVSNLFAILESEPHDEGGEDEEEE